MRRSRPHGLTLIELMVVVAIIGVVSVLAFDGMRRSRPRASLQNVSAELQSLVHQARLEALADRVRVVVMLFPDYAGSGFTGRIVVMKDSPTQQFLTTGAATLNLATYNPASPGYPTDAQGDGKVVTVFDFPSGVQVGPSGGSGLASLKFPYDGISLTSDCSFCGTDGGRRGAIVFDPRGRTSFCSVAATTITCLDDASTPSSSGGSFSIYSTAVGTGSTSTLLITCPTGMLRTLLHG